MRENPKNQPSWRGKYLRACVPFSQAGVAHHIWVGTDRGSLLIDAGDGALRDLLLMDIKPQELDAIFVTHGHFDHIGGLHTLLGFMRMVGRTRPLPIYLPELCSEALAMCETFKKLYADSCPFDITTIELPPREKIEVSGITVEPYDVVHCGSIAGGEILPRIPAFGFRVTLDGETVAISGDTGECESLRELVRGADLAIIEATFLESEGRSEELLKNVHLSENQATEIGKLAKRFVLVHKGKRG